MELKPGDILYRKYSDKNDLYCVVGITEGPFNVGPNPKRIRMFAYYSNDAANPTLSSELEDSASNWYIKVDLNNYEIKDKFLGKIKEFLSVNLGNFIYYDVVLDNLTYIEILAELKKYEKSDIVDKE